MPIVVDDDHPNRSSVQLFTAQEVCQLCNRSDRTIRKWRQLGRLRPVRIGRTLFYRVEDIKAILDEQISIR